MTQAADEAAADRLFAALRWPDGPRCPLCGSAAVGVLHGGHHGRPRHKCRTCRRQFSVTKSTILEGTHLHLTVWWRVVTVLTATPDGASIALLEREIGIGRTAARNVLARLLYAARRPPLADLLPPDPADGEPRLLFTALTAQALLAALLATPAPTDAPRVLDLA